MRLHFPWWLPVGRAPEISPGQFKTWLGNEHPPQIVDARTRLEYEHGTIGDALHAPLTGMPDSLAVLDLDKGQPVVVLCLSGHRSLPGTRWLRSQGFNAYSMQGGIMAWKQAGYELNDPIRKD